MLVPFIDLKSQYQSIKKEIDEGIRRVIKSGRFDQGEEVAKFEEEFKTYLKTRHCVSVNSGTDALILGVRALNLSPSDEIIVPTYTFVATAYAASENNLKPVFADVDEGDYGINLDDLKRKINSRTKAIILVHLYGQPDKIDEVKEIIKKTGRKIYLIEDAAQAHGAEYKGKKIGTFGIFSIFSFYPTKNLGAYGDGGAIITNDDALAKKYQLLKQYGQTKKYFYQTAGINSRLDTFQAAILRVKLKHLDEWNIRRRQLARYFTQLLNRKLPFIKTPSEFPERKSVYHLYVVATKKRNQLIDYLRSNQISALIHYPKPLHLQKVYAFLGYQKGDFPIAEKISQEIVSLPFYPEMEKTMVEYIINKIKDFYQKRLI